MTRSVGELLASSGSAMFHAGVVLALVLISYTRIEPLAEPPPQRPEPIPLVILEASDRREAAAAAAMRLGGGSEIAESTERPVADAADSPAPAAPTSLAETEGPEPGQGRGAAGAGGPGPGVPGGVPGGAIGGIIGGIVGGHRLGVPSGALDGLPSGDDPVPVIGDVSPPERTLHVSPVYPELARRARAEGTVVLQLVIGRAGDVEEVALIGSSPLFDTAAVEAVKKWKYRPALQGGRPVRVYMTVRVEFRLR